MTTPRIVDCLRSWADTAFEATAPQAFLLHSAADLLDCGEVVTAPSVPAACVHDWGMKILTSNPPKRRCELCGFTEVVPGAEFVKGHEAPDAALDAEADALRVACGGIFSWDDIGKGAQNDWRAVALKAREMHRRKIDIEEAVAAYDYGDKHSLTVYTQHRDGIRALLARVGVEVTP